MPGNISILIDGIDHASGAFGSVGKAMGTLEGNAAGLISRGLKPLQNLLETGIKVAAGAALGGIVALGAGLTNSINKSADMEQGVADMGASMNASAEDTARLKGLIEKLGLDPKLKVSATQATQAIAQLGTAGLSVDQILAGAAKSTVLLANATGADFGKAAAVSTDVMSLFNIKAENMEKAMNGIVGVTIASKFNFNDYAEALATGGKGAVAAGISFDQFNQMLTGTAANFTGGQTAGTGLTAMMLNLSPKTDDATNKMKELGIITAEGQNRFFDLNGEVRDNKTLSNVLRETLGKLNTQQRLNAVDMLFGRDAIGAINGMIGQTDESWDNFAKGLADTDAAKQAATRMDTFRGAMEILGGTFETIQIQVGDQFLPILKDLAKRFNELLAGAAPQIVEWAGRFAAKLSELIGRWLPSLLDRLGEWWLIGKNLATQIPAIVQSVTNFITAVKDFVQPMITWIASFTSLKDILIAVAAVFAGAAILALGEFLLAVAPVILVVGGLLLAAHLLRTAWDEDWGGIREKVGSVLGYLNERFGPLLTTIKDFGPAALTEIVNWALGNETSFWAVQVIWEKVKETARLLFSDLVSYVKTNLPAWIQSFANWGWAALQWIVDVTPLVLAGLVTLIKAIGLFAGEMILKFSRWLGSWYESAGPGMKLIIETITLALDGLLTLVRVGLDLLNGDFSAAWEHLSSGTIYTFTTLLGIVKNALILLWPVLVDMANALWTWIQPAIGPAITKLGEWATALFGWIKTNLPNWITNIQTWGAALWAWIQPMIGPATTKLGEWGTALWNWLSTNLPIWVQKLAPYAIKLVEWIGEAIPKAVEALTKWVDGMIMWSDTTGGTKTQQMVQKLGVAMLTALGKVGISLAALGLTVVGDLLINLAAGFLKWMGIDVSVASMHTHLLGLIDNLKKLLGEHAALIGGVILLAITPGVMGIATAIVGTVLPALGSFVFAIGGAVLTALGGLATTIWTVALPALGALLVPFLPIILIAAVVAAAIALLYVAWTTNFLGIRDKAFAALEAIKGFFSTLPANISAFGSSIYTAAGGLVTKIKEGINAFLNDPAGAINSVLDKVRSAFTAKMDGAGALKDSFFTNARGTIDNIRKGFDAVTNNPINAVDVMMDNIRNAFNNKIDGTGGWKNRFFAGARDTVDNLKVGFDAVTNNPVNAVNVLMDNIRNAFNGKIDGTEGWKNKFFIGARDTVTQLQAGFNAVAANPVGTINTILNAIVTAFNGRIGNGGDILNHLLSLGSGLGANLLTGIKNGIDAGIAAVMRAIEGITNALPQWVKDKLGIHSPSTVFAAFGLALMQGLAQGITAGFALPESALQGVTGSLQSNLDGLQLQSTGGPAGGSTETDNSRNTTNNFAVSIPTAGDQRPQDQMQSMFNTLTGLYTS